eukprot:6685901-Pyramimonas_sp.AAC.1
MSTGSGSTGRAWLGAPLAGPCLAAPPPGLLIDGSSKRRERGAPLRGRPMLLNITEVWMSPHRPAVFEPRAAVGEVDLRRGPTIETLTTGSNRQGA